MSCDICQRAHHPKRLPFLCVIDARNRLYDGRLANTRVLIEAEGLESRITKLLSVCDSASSSVNKDRPSRTYMENCASEEQEIKERTEKIIATADKLRDEVADAKRKIQERKADIARRKSDLATASKGLNPRRNREIEETMTAIKMTRYSWDQEYDAMTQYRAALSMEVAKLYRLQRVRRGNPPRFEYKIGGIDIIDLHKMNNAQPELISASLAHITHLLWLTSHYLSIRLPAEITLPHNDYPRPTIFSLQSSYHHGDVAFPGTSLLPPDPQDRQFAHVPHPRPLFLDKPLATLAKEDATLHNSFLEAICLLAYDIVWLCRTQGVPVGDSFEEFACIGRNLYSLLINSSLQRNPQQIADAASAQPNTATSGIGNNSHYPAELGRTAPRMGLFSHGTAHTFLGSAAGNELTRGFRMPNNIAKLVDKLKAKLARGDPAAAVAHEWELLEDDAWTPDDALDDGVLISNGSNNNNPARGAAGGGVPAHRYGIESYMSVGTIRSGGSGDTNPRVPVGRDREKEKDKEKGTSGWTKVKHR